MTNTSFITNEEGNKLLDRFAALLQQTKCFDCIVGYFYKSGFHLIYKNLENVEKIRILIGIGTDTSIYDSIQLSKIHSTKETKDAYVKNTIEETQNINDSLETEEGIKKFIEWIVSGKLEIRAYPEPIHAKLYIMTFKKGYVDIGRVIMGSSNLTYSGLQGNLEFDAEFQRPEDYSEAIKRFENLWKTSVEVSNDYVETIKKKTWLNDQITPYELYLKFLYEYLKEKINIDKEDLFKVYFPENFMDLEYQKDAVKDAVMKLKEYGGVFISDVVGLGKTYIAAMLAKQLDGGTLVIAPPVLLDKDNPGSWVNVFFEFGVQQTDFESIGMLDKVIHRGTEKYKNIIIDESHRFRTESTQMYEHLFEICRGKRVILVSATPLNNTPKDILSQIKLFQNAHKSTLPSPKVRDLEKYFMGLQNKLKDLNRQENKEDYLKIVKENADDIRQNILQYLMVRRTRSNISKYYGRDLQKQGLKFPEVVDPKHVLYYFSKDLDGTFNKTLKLIINEFKYARYTPLLYLKEDITQPEELSQKNMGKFMKVLLLKRLESSFFAFKQSISRFFHSYERFIEEYKKGHVFVSKKYTDKIFELLEDDNEEALNRLLEEEKAFKYKSTEFKHDFIKDLENDYQLLKKINEMWKHVDHDPKLDKFSEILSKDTILKEHKILIFTESKETAEYLKMKLTPKLGKSIMTFSSSSSEDEKRKIIENFDANLKRDKQKNDIKVLISTDILSEGVSLHRSNVVINYDIPWNPVRMMQRVGRVNRVSKNPPYNTIYTYNFFPAGPINKEIGLKEAAESKIKAFIEMLGNDAKLLTDEEIKTHDLFMKLTSKETITGEDEKEESELEYLTFLRNIRDNYPELFQKIKNLPRKARTAKKYDTSQNFVLTFFRKGKLRKIYITDENHIEEIDFFKAVKILQSEKDTRKDKWDASFYRYLEKNKKEFDSVFYLEEETLSFKGRSQEGKLIKILRVVTKSEEYTDEDGEYIYSILNLLKEGGIAKATIKKMVKDIKNETNPIRILSVIKRNISPNLFQGTFIKSAADTSGPKEVILSEYLIRNG